MYVCFRFSIWWYPELMQDPVFFINNFIYLLPPVSVGMYLSYNAISLLVPQLLQCSAHQTSIFLNFYLKSFILS